MKDKKILTAVVIAKNEEERIGKCLESVSFCDERILIDNNSTDDTPNIAKKHGATVINESSSDFSVLRNRGKDQACGQWILYVDADEIVPEELKKEILEIIRQGTMSRKYGTGDNKQETKRRMSDAHCLMSHGYNGYYISRINYYLGYKWPVKDKMQRLFLKTALIRWEGKLHETARITGQIGDLREPLIHDTHRSLEEMVAKTNEWSAVEAKLRFDQHHPKIVCWRLLRVMVTGFNRSFFREGGWRMGTVGWIESIYQAFSMFLTYAKLWEMQEKKKV